MKMPAVFGKGHRTCRPMLRVLEGTRLLIDKKSRGKHSALTCVWEDGDGSCVKGRIGKEKKYWFASKSMSMSALWHPKLDYCHPIPLHTLYILLLWGGEDSDLQQYCFSAHYTLHFTWEEPGRPNVDLQPMIFSASWHGAYKRHPDVPVGGSAQGRVRLLVVSESFCTVSWTAFAGMI
jgi:hypothetical protein